ncbi:MAG: hypothetical protein ACW98D_10025 [Promethearchaeota archaeon]|jgi:hypothetical protein
MEKKSEEKTNNKKIDYLKELKFNIERANEITRLIENRRKSFLEINLALLPAFSIVVAVFSYVFNIWGIISISFSMILYFVITIKNIWINLKESETEDINPAICSYTRNFNINQHENFQEYNFQEDYDKQIRNLHKYQENYDTIAKQTRSITLIGIIILLISLILSVILNFIGMFFT